MTYKAGRQPSMVTGRWETGPEFEVLQVVVENIVNKPFAAHFV